jgi:UDP-N-acetylmuramoylalanine--D-glutamate ligase
MRVVLAGFGQEGKASYDYWNVDGNELAIADERDSIADLPDGVPTITGADAFSKLSDFDLIVRSPSVNPRKLPYGDKVWSATNEFFEKCPAPIIGVTGTKGKGTTSSLIASILEADGKKVHLLGNIGLPALSMMARISPDDIVVFEMSSFQLWDLQKSPQVAVILKVEADHLDVHSGMPDYIAAKSNIRRYQSEAQACFYHPTNSISAEIANILPGARRYGLPEDGGVYVRDGSFMREQQVICSVDEMQIPGEHNIENACAAISAAGEFLSDFDAVSQGLRSFTGLPHRIKFVAKKNDVAYYDDSYSSAPSASMAAIRSFESPKIILLGGYDKGADFTDLANMIASDPTVKQVIVYGQTKGRIVQALYDASVDPDRTTSLETTNYSEIIARAAAEAIPGDVVLLSPACASFDMFKNFTERGEQFIKIVESL